MNDLQQQVQEAIDRLVESGTERGLQVAVYRHGEQVVDAVAGVADPATGRPVTSDTPFYAYSVGKGATSSVAHVLAEREVFGYDTPIIELWPEFGAHGKENATVRHALTHTVGVPGIPADTTPEDLCDWEKMCAVIADELYFGVPETEQGRLAWLEDAEGSAEFLAAMPDDAPFFKLGPRAVTPTAEFGNRPDILAADIPAGGKMSARAMARMYAALLDEVDGVRLVPPERLREITAAAFSGVDQIMGNPVTWALGYSIGRLGSDPRETPTAFGFGGVGGSFAYADTATGVTFALTKNKLTPDFSAAEQIDDIVT